MARPSNQEKSQPPTGTAAPSATSSSKPDTTAILLATAHTHKQDTEGHRVRCVPDQAAKDSLTRPNRDGGDPSGTWARLGWEPRLAFAALALAVTGGGRGPFSLPPQ